MISNTDLQEMKRIEVITLSVRFLAPPFLLLAVWLHEPANSSVLVALSIAIVPVNLAIYALNRSITEKRNQLLLGVSAMAIDTAIIGIAASQFLHDFNTASHAGFAVVVIQGAIRFGTTGALVTAAVFALWLAGAMLARGPLYDLRFSYSGYAFWAAFMTLIALGVGIPVSQSRRQQAEIRRLSADQAALRERHRISRELHDNVLKTLHGISLEAHALREPGSQPPQRVAAVGEYLEKVCQTVASDIQALVFDLRHEGAPSLDEQLATLVNEPAYSGLTIRQEESGRSSPLPPQLVHDLVSSIREALFNVRKHSDAQNVAIRLAWNGNALNISVQDDGRPVIRDPTSVRGIGLISMEERLNRWDGQLTFTRSKSGSSLTLQVPLPEATVGVEVAVDG